MRHILFQSGDYENDEACKAAADAMLEKFKSGAADENSFADLAKKNSSDTGSYYNGGLYENVGRDKMVEEFENWIFDEKRETGDCEVIKTSYGYHVMYYVGEGLGTTDTEIYDTVRNERYSKIANDLATKYAVTVDSDKMNNIPDIA